MGVRNIQTDCLAGVISSKAVSDDDEILLMSSSGIVMRTPASEISIQKRGTRGVRVMKLDDGDSLVGFTIVKPEPEEIETGGVEAEAGVETDGEAENESENMNEN